MKALLGQMSFFDLCNEKKSEMEDLIEKDLLQGTLTENSKKRIFEKYRDVRFEQFVLELPGIYGLGGWYKSGYSQTHSSKGIEYKIEIPSENYRCKEKVLLSWSDVAKRIEKLILEGRYI